MTGAPIAIRASGIACAVGLDAPAACAAIRAAVSNAQDTLFSDHNGEPIRAAGVFLPGRPRQYRKLSRMLALCIGECLSSAPQPLSGPFPLLLCTSERDRPGRPPLLDDRLFGDVGRTFPAQIHPGASAVLPLGRAGGVLALAHARSMLAGGLAQAVLIAGVDSYLSSQAVASYEFRQRLLTSENSDGFVPGEAAAAILIGPATPGAGGDLLCTGIGTAQEVCTIESGEPLRALGLTAAVRSAVAEAGCTLGELDCRLSDANGEQYAFREASLALSRTMRERKERFPLVTPADCVGEVGAAVGPLLLAVALASHRKRYGPGSRTLLHVGSDSGLRVAAVLRGAEDWRA